MKSAKEVRPNVFYGPVPSKAFAIRLIEAIGKTLIVIAAFNAMLALIFVEASLLSAVLISLMAFWLYTSKSRQAAVVLLFFSAFASFAVTVNLYLGIAQPMNVALAYATFLIAIRAVHATFELGRFKK